VTTEPEPWRKSTFSSQGNDCVEVNADLGDGMRGIRDSKDPDGPALAVSAAALAAFIQGAKAGEFDDLT